MKARVKTKHLISLLLACLALPVFGGGIRVIDDVKLRSEFQKKIGELCDKDGVPDGKKLSDQESKAPRVAKNLHLPKVAPPKNYEEAVQSIALLGKAGHCGSKKCKKWHLRGVATAWCVGAEGLFVTNFHCFEGTEGKASAIYLLDGTISPVVEIVAADRDRDVCLFRVKAKGGKKFNPLPMGEPAPVGTPVRIISHPDNRFYMQTSGKVARYYLHPPRNEKKAAVWMNVTADYAKGSSGGPVLDERGEVVGMVSFTSTIYYGPRKPGGDKGPMQMVVKSCVPGEALRKLLSLDGK